MNTETGSAAGESWYQDSRPRPRRQRSAANAIRQRSFFCNAVGHLGQLCGENGFRRSSFFILFQNSDGGGRAQKHFEG